MGEHITADINRRSFVTQLVPACSLACLGLGSLQALAMTGEKASEGATHKFDEEIDVKMSLRQRITSQNRAYIGFIKTLQKEVDQEQLIRLLELNSAELGRQVGSRQAKNAPDHSFQTFVGTFRPPNYKNSLTHKIVEDSAKVFELKVTECIWASVFRDAGLGGEIGHAALCHMDYHWPPAFNSAFKMERSRTLMQGHDCCNHRYLDTT